MKDIKDKGRKEHGQEKLFSRRFKRMFRQRKDKQNDYAIQSNSFSRLTFSEVFFLTSPTGTFKNMKKCFSVFVSLLSLIGDYFGRSTVVPTFFLKQESPPAWTQETYRPLLIKYSLLHGTLVSGGYPRQVPPWLGDPHPDLARGVPQVGTPHPDLTGGGGYPGRCPLAGVPSHPDLARGYPRWVPSGWGTPPPCPDLARGVYPGQAPPCWGTPHPDLAGGNPGRHPLAGVPPSDLAGVPAIWTWPGSPHQVWTDWKHYLPSSFGYGR